MKNGPEPSGMKLWVTLAGNEPRPTEVLAEGLGNTEWVEGNSNYQLQLRDQL